MDHKLPHYNFMVPVGPLDENFGEAMTARNGDLFEVFMDMAERYDCAAAMCRDMAMFANKNKFAAEGCSGMIHCMLTPEQARKLVEEGLLEEAEPEEVSDKDFQN